MNHNQFKKILLKNKKFKAEYENKSDISYEIAKSIRQLRINHGLTQEELAKLVKTEQPSIARIENPGSKAPSLNFLQRIAKALNTELIPPKFSELETFSFPVSKSMNNNVFNTCANNKVEAEVTTKTKAASLNF